jgi:uncharacterized membrane protein YciS (DUF1049 family)
MIGTIFLVIGIILGLILVGFIFAGIGMFISLELKKYKTKRQLKTGKGVIRPENLTEEVNFEE